MRKEGDRLADDFRRGISIDRFGASVPAGNDAVQSLADDCIAGRFHDGGKFGARRVLSLAFGNVSTNAKEYFLSVYLDDAGVNLKRDDGRVLADAGGFKRGMTGLCYLLDPFPDFGSVFRCA